MPFNEGVGLTYRVQDIKGKSSTFTIGFPNTADVPAVASNSPYDVGNAPSDGFASSTAALIKPLILGAIVSAGISIRINLDGAGLKTVADPYSDIEEGCHFSWRSVVGAPTKFRAPTFKETYGFGTGQALDTSDPDVDAFIQRILQGDTQGATTVRFSDSRGNNISSLALAEEKFKKSRRRR